MITFKDFINEHVSKETPWSNNLTSGELRQHLQSTKAAKVWTGMGKNPLHQRFHVGASRNIIPGRLHPGIDLFRHRITEYGHHEIRSINTNTPNHILTMHITEHGKVLYGHHHETKDIIRDGKPATETSRVDEFNGK